MRRAGLHARLGIYVDGPYRLVRTDLGWRIAPYTTDLPFLTFACEVAQRFDSLVVFARARLDSAAPDALLPAGVRIQRLPDFGNARNVGPLIAATLGTARGFWRGLRHVDTVWAFGPHPFSILLASLAIVRGKAVVLGVRQDTLAYTRQRLPAGRLRPKMLLVRVLDRAFRALGRRVPVTVVGPRIAESYGGLRPGLHLMTVSQIRLANLAETPSERSWEGRVELLAVGRMDPEKNPMLLVEAVAELERRLQGGVVLTWVGTGPMEAEVRRRAAQLGVARLIDFVGFVPFGEGLMRRYREAHAFVHVSLTEGVPATIIEALASGVPVVGTDVGGVRHALDDGRAGLLVPPSDGRALVDAVVRLSAEPDLRRRMSRRGLELARERSMDVQAESAARFLMRATR